MTQAISIINSEHIRIRHILMMVTELRKKLEHSNATPDATLFNSIFDYIDSYERMHYPKEEQYLFKALRARNPGSHAILDELEGEHSKEPPMIARLRGLLQDAMQGSADARQAFLETLAELVRWQEAHMEKEETAVIPMALKSLGDEDWQTVNEGYLHYDHLLHPLVGETVRAEFDELHSRVIYYAPEPLGLGFKRPPTTTETQALGLSHGLNVSYGHIRALQNLSEQDWQAINDQYLHHDDPNFGRVVTTELRQLRSQLAYYAPTPIGLGMERTHTVQVPAAVDQVLKISGLTSHYGRIQALDDINLEINKGELVALVGSNGAGKTTLLRTISGLQRASGGSIAFVGRDITALRADQRVRLGITQIPEGRQVFGPMSVEDNLLLGAYTRPQDKQIAVDMEQMYKLFPILKQKCKQAAGTLSGGQQQMLAMARALMSRPQLLLLDEPSMGLAPILVEEIFDTVEELKRRGITIFLVEQNASAALAIADRGYVLETGHIVLAGAGQDLLSDNKVKAAYLGI